jgi:hypothetical protein
MMINPAASSHHEAPSCASSIRRLARSHEVRHDTPMQVSTAVWIAIGVGAIGVAMAILMFIRPQTRAVDLGSVSEQWVAQHRTGPMHDS